jgi:hypothetical protein
VIRPLTIDPTIKVTATTSSRSIQDDYCQEIPAIFDALEITRLERLNVTVPRPPLQGGGGSRVGGTAAFVGGTGGSGSRHHEQRPARRRGVFFRGTTLRRRRGRGRPP